MSYILLIGSIQAFFWGALILIQNNTYLPNKVLMIWMFLLGLNLLGAFGVLTGFYEAHPKWYGYDSTLVLLHGPFTYLYVLYFTNSSRKPRVKDLLHFVPYLFFTIYFIYQVRRNGPDYESIKQIFYDPDPIIISMLVSVQGLLFAYSILIFITLRKQRKHIEESYSFSEGVDLLWVRRMLWILIVTMVFMVVGTISSDFYSFVSIELKTYFFYGGLSLIPFYISYQVVSLDILKLGSNHTASERYAGSNLLEDDSMVILKKLDDLMESEKPYLDSYLSLNKLADMLDVHSKHLSQVINEHKKLSFFNYVNQYRVHEVIHRMSNKTYQHFTILAIANDAGFNTKSAFNKSFKRVTGLTPSAYKKQAN